MTRAASFGPLADGALAFFSFLFFGRRKESSLARERLSLIVLLFRSDRRTNRGLASRARTLTACATYRTPCCVSLYLSLSSGVSRLALSLLVGQPLRSTDRMAALHAETTVSAANPHPSGAGWPGGRVGGGRTPTARMSYPILFRIHVGPPKLLQIYL